MTVPADLAERAPHGGAGPGLGPPGDAPETPGSPGEPVQSRVTRLMGRRQERRQRRLWALLGLVLLAAAFGVTVAVLDVLR